MKRDSILMHPLPRNEEIEIGCDANFRTKYFEQIKKWYIHKNGFINRYIKSKF